MVKFSRAGCLRLAIIEIIIISAVLTFYQSSWFLAQESARDKRAFARLKRGRMSESLLGELRSSWREEGGMSEAQSLSWFSNDVGKNDSSIIVDSRKLNLCGGSDGEEKPSPETLVFVHMFNTGGSALTDVLEDWATGCADKSIVEWGVDDLCDKSAELCNSPCDKRRNIPTPCDALTSAMNKYNVVLGHWYFGVHKFYTSSVYVTSLRHPVLAYVSGILSNPSSGDLDNVYQGVEVVERKIVQHREARLYRADYLQRLTGFRPLTVPAGALVSEEVEEASEAALRAQAVLAMENLHNFAVVGISDQWNVTLKMVNQLVAGDSTALADKFADHSVNVHRQSFTTEDVIAELGPDTLAEVEEYVKYETVVYEQARLLSYAQCMRYMPRVQCSCLLELKEYYPGQHRPIIEDEWDDDDDDAM